jgi:hypothetical protein
VLFTWSSHAQAVTGLRSGAALSAATVTVKKSSAINEARRLAQQHPLGQVVIKNENGRIEREYTYGKDPRRFPG